MTVTTIHTTLGTKQHRDTNGERSFCAEGEHGTSRNKGVQIRVL